MGDLIIHLSEFIKKRLKMKQQLNYYVKGSVSP